jgi:hypothetical protein
VIVANVSRASYLMTDEAVSHTAVGREFAGHGTVNHSAEEYVRAYFWTQTRSRITSPSSSAGSSAFTIMFSEAHLHRYTAEVRFPLQ